MVIKKLFVVLSFLCMVAVNVHAETDTVSENSSVAQSQRQQPRRFEYGLQLGVNSSTLVGENAESSVISTRQAVRFVGGGFLRLRVSDWLRIQPELLFTRKGTDFEFNGMDDGGLYFSYLELPLLVRTDLPWSLTIRDEVTTRPYFLGGPWVSLLLSAQSFDPDAGTRNNKDSFDTVDFGATLGLGVSVEPVWWGGIEVSARYVHGIPQIGNTDDGRDDAKHRTFSVMLGFRCCAHRQPARSVEDELPEPIDPVDPAPGETEPGDTRPEGSPDVGPGDSPETEPGTGRPDSPLEGPDHGEPDASGGEEKGEPDDDQ